MGWAVAGKNMDTRKIKKPLKAAFITQSVI